ncbi:hypothetical protein MVEN_01243800 [Mycena venus]|uniref:STB6-like N-terminal domain-containing protein n=1 Tax=Mycena venus TaxID=2733690 RepID=A0A8H6Y504_9AGAR|nr:hypothetical protein MVEN_01243800 [Mycena venus]
MPPTLLLPTVRQPNPRPPAQQTHSRTKSTSTKLVRPNASSLDVTAPLPRPWSPTDIANDWIGLPLHFEIVTERLELEGYQIYAVEKWIVERDRPVTVLTVYTGDPAHKITVTALSPATSLSPAEATAEWDKAILHLRRDARPRDTQHGVVLATSLANFRSDYTIVNIPTGDFLQARDQLYTNINLLRMGCSGRSALTLEEPSETTKDRFIATYHLPDTILSGGGHTASATFPVIPPAPGSPVPTPKPSPSKHRPRLSISPPNPRRSEDSKASSPISPRRPPGHLHITPPTPTFTVPHGAKSRADRATFSASVLELVRLIQASLAIFGLFPADPRALDGLLCDKTVEGLNTWVDDVGEQCVNIEATERIADPAVVCALLSLVVATRNKLAAAGFGHVTPKGPVPAPARVPRRTWRKGASTPATPSFAFHLHHAHSLPPTPGTSTLAFFGAAALARPVPNVNGNGNGTSTMVLTRALVDTISTAYSDKARAGERRRSRGPRALLRLDGEASDGSDKEGADAGAQDGSGQQILTGIGSLASVDLEAFVRVVVGRGKDKGKPRLKGKTREKEGRAGEGDAGGENVNLKEREKDAAVVSGVAGCGPALHASPVKRDTLAVDRDRDRAKDRWAPVVVSDGDTEEIDTRPPKGEKDGRSTEEEGGTDRWGGRVQKKFESWTRLSRLDRKKGHASVDLSSGRDSLDDPNSLRKRPPIPLGMAQMTFSRGDAEHGEEELSSGQVSPTDDPRTPKNFGALHATSAASSAANIFNLEEYDRKLSAFNHKRPWGTRLVQNRISSWSDPVSAREILDGDDSEEESAEGEEGSSSVASGSGTRPRRARGANTGSKLAQGSVLGEEESVLYEEPSDAAGYLSDAPPVPPASRRRPVALGVRRRRSWHQDPKSFKDLKVLSPERMRIDVALCGQVLIMMRREEHLKNVLACVQVLTASLSETNTRLREDYQRHVRALLEVEQQTKAIADIDVEASKAYKISQAQNTISYETQQFQVRELWHIASPPRRTTFALRDKVFGMGGRRLPPGKHGAHGRFNRLQWTLDGQERLVDHLGRTESEAEEESVVEDIEGFHLEPTEDSEEVIKHPAMRPMWLLRFFTSWGAKWGASEPDADATAKAKAGSENTPSRNEKPVESEETKGRRSPSTTPIPRAGTSI